MIESEMCFVLVLAFIRKGNIKKGRRVKETTSISVQLNGIFLYIHKMSRPSRTLPKKAKSKWSANFWQMKKGMLCTQRTHFALSRPQQSKKCLDTQWKMQPKSFSFGLDFALVNLIRKFIERVLWNFIFVWSVFCADYLAWCWTWTLFIEHSELWALNAGITIEICLLPFIRCVCAFFHVDI